MKKVYVCKEVIVPQRVIDQLDEITSGGPNLTEIMTRDGMLHDRQKHLLAICLMHEFENLLGHNVGKKMEALGGTSYSLERFSVAVFVTALSYICGLINWPNEDKPHASIQIGTKGFSALEVAMDIVKADEVQFTNGKRLPAKEFLKRIKQVSSIESLQPAYKHVFKKGVFGGMKELDGVDVYALVLTTMKMADMITEFASEETAE